MKKNMFTETEMTSLLFTRAEENGVRSTSRENLAFKLPLNQHRSVTRQNFRDLETVPGTAEQMPHHTVDVWHREGHCHHRLGCRLNLTLPCHPGESDSVLSRSKPLLYHHPPPQHCQALLSPCADGSSSPDQFRAPACD